MEKPPIAPRPLTPEGEKILAEVEDKRGYLLPYHRMLAESAPDLLAAYDRFYERLTLTPRVLSPYQKETIWAALLAVAREAHGFIHMRRAVAAGLTEADRVRAVAIAGLCEAFAVIHFAAEHWSAWTMPQSLEATYRTLFAHTIGDLDPKLAHLTALVCHGARRQRAGTVLHLSQAFAAGATPAEICEGLSYMLIPCGGNVLIDAVSFWEDAARDGLMPGPY